MTAIRVAIGLIWVASLVAGRIMWYPVVTSPIALTSAEITDQFVLPTVTAPLTVSPEADESSDPRVDLFGNEIEDALADYRIDRRGGVYERHSPATAVAGLGIPST